MRKVIFQTMYSGAIKIVGAGLTFLMFMFLARAMSAEEYGRFAVMFSLGTFCALLALFGQHTRILKRLSASLESQNYSLGGNIFWQSWFITASLGALISVSLLIAAFCVHLFSLEFDYIIIVGASFLLIPFAFAELASAQMRVLGGLVWALLPRDILWRTLVVLIAIASTTGLFFKMNAPQFIAVIALLLFALVVFQCFFLKRILPNELKPIRLALKLSVIRKESSWLWLASVVTAFSTNLSVLAVGFSLSTADAGAFFAAAKLSQLLHLPMMAVSVVAAPTIARLIERGDPSELQRFCSLMVVLLASGAALGCAILMSDPVWFLTLLNPEFDIAGTTLTVLVLSHFLVSLCGTTTTLMLMSKGEKKFVCYQGVFDGLALVLVLLFSFWFGMVGAAVAILFGKIGWNVAAVRWCIRTLSINPSIFGIKCLFKAE